MKKILINCFVMAAVVALWMGCKRDNDYIISTPSDFIANFDLRKLYRGSDVTLTKENMRAATSLKGQVISDHSGNNMPAGLLVVQNLRATGNGIDSLRGIAINIGADAAKYVPGDSVHVKIEGGVLKRVDGILEITGIAGANVTKISSGRKLILNRGFVNLIQSQPDKYECTFLNIWKGTYNPSLASSDVFSGSKTLNDGTGDITLFTQNNAVFANLKPPYSADYKGIVFNSLQEGKLVPRFCIRTIDDVFTLSATRDVPEVIITGFINDPQGSDTNAEYIQCRATKDINFADTKFTIVTNNNAGTTVPLGVPAEGWATGSGKTYKLELTSGTVSKGEFFYVGASNKLINGAGSTSMATSKWIRSAAYNTNSPYFNASNTTRGSSTTNLLANSGNAFGIAVFRGLSVDKNTVPIDVVFVHNGGSLYDAGSQTGYRIGNTDVYDVVDHNTNKVQPFFLSGSNTQKFTYQPNAGASDGSGQGYWFALGGVFDTTLGKWVKARSHIHIKLSSTSAISEIETTNATELK